MGGPWETLTIKNHSDSELCHAQINASASVNWRLRDGSGREIGGHAYLQRMPGSAEFRLLVEGIERIGGKEKEVLAYVRFPSVSKEWTIIHEALKSDNAGKVLAVRVNFAGPPDPSAAKWIQLTMPIISGNSRKAKAMLDAITFAKLETLESAKSVDEE